MAIKKRLQIKVGVTNHPNPPKPPFWPSFYPMSFPGNPQMPAIWTFVVQSIATGVQSSIVMELDGSYDSGGNQLSNNYLAGSYRYHWDSVSGTNQGEGDIDYGYYFPLDPLSLFPVYAVTLFFNDGLNFPQGTFYFWKGASLPSCLGLVINSCAAYPDPSNEIIMISSVGTGSYPLISPNNIGF